jgi:hypothetical protein
MPCSLTSGFRAIQDDCRACEGPCASECIADNVIHAPEHPDLGGIAKRARILVEREFTYEKAMERWKEILDDVCDGR